MSHTLEKAGVGLVTPAPRCYNKPVSPRLQVTAEVSSRYRPRSKTWAYGLDDLAGLLNTTEGALRARLRRGSMGFDPGDLLAVCRAVVAAQDGPRTVVVGPGHHETLLGALGPEDVVPGFVAKQWRKAR